ncbi:unnamed protein product [Fraxinus pennsylvanica]|uniref:Uncharacterized protein n=1 Tax=Fraxinus pennsylvanica TaxID=56036 RepID=A0AAD2DJ47_9LAMI|nr:unnamed protein product [Fraxinus pennsylvanica]
MGEEEDEVVAGDGSGAINVRRGWDNGDGRGFQGRNGVRVFAVDMVGVECVRPLAFFVEFLFSSGLVLKGPWVLQVGISLYTDAFGLKGCAKISRVAPMKGESNVQWRID